jgi:hypothetical protein
MNSCVLEHLRTRLEAGMIRPTAEAVFIHDEGAPRMETLTFRQTYADIRQYVHWRARTAFNETPLCVARGVPRLMCRRSRGSFQILAVPLAQLPLAVAKRGCANQMNLTRQRPGRTFDCPKTRENELSETRYLT